MTWVLLDDQFPQHPKVVGVGPLGIAMQVAGLCYCNRYLTDGFIPRAAIPGLIDFAELDEHAFNGIGGVCWRAVEKLVAAGMWEETERGFQIHDFLDYQRSRAEILAQRGKTLDRVHKYRKARRNARVTLLHQECNGGVTGAPTPVPSTQPQYPVPSTPPHPAGDTTRKKAAPVYPEWFSPITRLAGFLPANHTRAIDAIIAACAVHDINPGALMLEFAAYWPRGRLPTSQGGHGWTNPVRALIKTLDVQIGKHLQGGNSETDRRHNEGHYPSPAHIPGSEHTIPDSEYPPWVPLPSRVGL